MSAPNPGTMAGNIKGQHKGSGDHGGHDGGAQQADHQGGGQQGGDQLGGADLQKGEIPLPNGGHATPANAPTLGEHAEASKHGQMAGQKYDEDHPGDWDHQINRAAYQHQAGKKQDPTPDHGGKGYQFDPDSLRAVRNDLKDIKAKASDFEKKLRQARDAGSPPAPDPKSRKHVHDLRASLGKAIKEAEGITKYVDGLINSLNRTLTDYNRAEEQNATDLRRNQT